MLKEFEELSDPQVQEKLALAAKTFLNHRNSPFAERAASMTRAAELLERNAERYGRLMTIEMGKPITASIAEVRKCALVCRFYAENAERFLSDEYVATDATSSYIHYQPLGVILAIMPWNFPFWQVFRFAAPALMAGN